MSPNTHLGRYCRCHVVRDWINYNDEEPNNFTIVGLYRFNIDIFIRSILSSF